MTKLSKRLRKSLLIVCPLGAVGLLGFFFASRSPKPTITYAGQPMEVWFYGTRDNFFQEVTRKKAQEAIDALGTNAFPFLLANLKENRGDGNLHFRGYQAMPKWIQSRVYYPLLDDDIKVVTLGHIRNMPGVTAVQIQELADCVPALANPRVRIKAFNLIRMNHQNHPAYWTLCRKLVEDEHQGIRLEAAISLAESAIASDPGEPELFPILIAALESKTKRDASVELSQYSYRKQPPGGVGMIPTPAFLPPLPSQEAMLRNRVEAAVYRLERHLTPEEKDRFRRALKD